MRRVGPQIRISREDDPHFREKIRVTLVPRTVKKEQNDSGGEYNSPRTPSSNNTSEPERPKKSSTYLKKIEGRLAEKSQELHKKVFGEGLKGALKTGYVRHIGDDDSTLGYVEHTREGKVASKMVDLARQLSNESPGLGTKAMECVTDACIKGSEILSSVQNLQLPKESQEARDLKGEFNFEYGGRKNKKKRKNKTKRRKARKNRTKRR
jgi:hypothetical protein